MMVSFFAPSRGAGHGTGRAVIAQDVAFQPLGKAIGSRQVMQMRLGPWMRAGHADRGDGLAAITRQRPVFQVVANTVPIDDVVMITVQHRYGPF
jgi:hypothetical protein